jgi:hypothetical protein
VLGLGDPFDFAAGTGSYFEGLQAGYNRELPSGLVIGAQADVSFPNTLLGTQTITAAGLDVADYQEKVLAPCAGGWATPSAPGSSTAPAATRGPTTN